jgi:DNA-directed RNA polymerase specialized sigma54-like protein
VLGLIQQIAPVGVAARDMRESLLLQIDYLARVGAPTSPIVRRIVSDHLEDLASHKHGYIAGQLGISADEVEAAREFIRNQLSPSPQRRRGRGRARVHPQPAQPLAAPAPGGAPLAQPQLRPLRRPRRGRRAGRG